LKSDIMIIMIKLEK